MMRFDSRVAMVTGAAGGIGAAVAARLAAEGAAVAVVDLEEARAQKIADQICLEGGQALGIGCDVTELEDVTRAVERIEGQLGPVDSLVTCAGVLRDNLLFKMSMDDWHQVIATHLTGTFTCARVVQASMVSRGFGKMVFLSSDSAMGSRGQTNYAAAKAGIEGMAKTIAIELGKFNINVNAVAPGFVETAMTRATAERLGMDYEEFKAASAAKAALARVATAEDIAGVVAFLASEDARMLTGQVLVTRGSP